MKNGANGTFLVGGGGCAHGPADVICTGFAQDSKALLDVIGSVNGVGVHANNHFASGFLQGGVQTGGNDTAGIVQQPDFRIFCGEAFQEFACAVIGDTIGDEDLEVPVRQFLGENGFQAILDIAGLIPAGENDRDQGRL